MTHSSIHLETPVTVIFFRRPDTLRAVMERVREVRPRELHLVADGPRSRVEGEAERCAEAREVAESMVDWPCEVRRHYAEANMGCGQRPASGISAVFEETPASIILEDDCVADPTFFLYCEKLLRRHWEDERIAQICGSSFFPDKLDARYSYGFTRYTLCWGWATWRRAWRHFDYGMAGWPPAREHGMLRELFHRREDRAYWDRHLQRVYEGDDTVWDLRWMFAVWRARMLSIVPRANLITNVGFGTDSTHTTNDVAGGRQPLESMQFPLVHPPVVLRAVGHDELVERTLFRKGGNWGRVKHVAKQVLPGPVVRYARALKQRRLSAAN